MFQKVPEHILSEQIFLVNRKILFDYFIGKMVATEAAGGELPKCSY